MGVSPNVPSPVPGVPLSSSEFLASPSTSAASHLLAALFFDFLLGYGCECFSFSYFLRYECLLLLLLFACYFGVHVQFYVYLGLGFYSRAQRRCIFRINFGVCSIIAHKYSMIKWTTLDSFLVFTESGSKLYINFEFCEEKNHRHFKNMLIYKAKLIMMTKNFQIKFTCFRR